MKPIHQTEFGEPNGNCLQAALASLFERPLAEVPNFMALGEPQWWFALQRWLFTEYDVWLVVTEALPEQRAPYGYHLIYGKSPRGDFNHVVVGYRGEIVFDPHPDGTGLQMVEGFYLFVSTLEHPGKSP